MFPPEIPENEIPLVLNYRSLKTGFFITLVWLGLGLFCLYLIYVGGHAAGEMEFFILAAAALFCLIFSLHSLNSSGGPFLCFFEDQLIVNHSMVRKITLHYQNVTGISIANEEIEFIQEPLPPVVINLAVLSFEDQERCLHAVNRLFPHVMQSEEGKKSGKLR